MAGGRVVVTSECAMPAASPLTALNARAQDVIGVLFYFTVFFLFFFLQITGALVGRRFQSQQVSAKQLAVHLRLV